ncbi:MAG: cell division protein ZapD [Thiolinea sp.]
MITYEQPLNEKIRLFLRLELLVRRFKYHIDKDSQPDTLAALGILLDLYNLSARIDLKSDVIKEIDRMSQSVRRIIDTTGKQDETLEILTDHSNALYQLRGPLGQHLRSHIFFSNLRQRASLAGGINGFDIPMLNQWLEQQHEARSADLRSWGEAFVLTADAAEYILGLIRTYCDGEEHVARDGFFQMSLGLSKTYQMLQIELPEGRNIYPEISAGKQRFSLRFVEVDMLSERGKQLHDSVSFRLKLCSF